MFSRNDHVTTKMGKLPPSPCKACGSDNHWDKGCPDWEIYKARTTPSKKGGYLTERDVDEWDKLYQTAFSILLSQQLAATQIDFDQVKSDFEAAVLHDEIDVFQNVEVGKNGHKSGKEYRTTIEEVDNEDDLEARRKSKSEKHLLYHIDESQQQEEPEMTKHPTRSSKRHQPTSLEEVDDEFWSQHYAKPKTQQHILTDSDSNEIYPETKEAERYIFVSEQKSRTELSEHSSEQDKPLPPPPKEIKPVRMKKKRFYPVGESSVGISVLSVKGRVGNQNNDITDLRLDSCTDVTLISAEYYNSLRSAPSIQQGIRMKLWQLTDKDSTLKGFVRIPIFMTTEDGVTLKSEVEAYVVPGMTVPILLGEDYQLTYEIGVTRNVEEGPRVQFGKSDYEVSARQVEQTKDFKHLRQSACSVGSFIKNKLHRRNKNKRHRLKIKFRREGRVVRAKEDYRLRPHECKPIQVEGQLDEDRDWLVTKTLLSGVDDSYFAVPNTHYLR